MDVEIALSFLTHVHDHQSGMVVERIVHARHDRPGGQDNNADLKSTTSARSWEYIDAFYAHSRQSGRGRMWPSNDIGPYGTSY